MIIQNIMNIFPGPHGHAHRDEEVHLRVLQEEFHQAEHAQQPQVGI